MSLRENCPNTEFFLVHIFLYSVWIQENTDKKKLRIWAHSTQCVTYEVYSAVMSSDVMGMFFW